MKNFIKIMFFASVFFAEQTFAQNTLKTKADEKFSAKNYEAALLFYKQIPDSLANFEIYFRIGRCLQEQTKFSEAADYFIKAEAQKSHFSHYANFYTARCYLKNENYNLAKTYYEKALQVENSPFYTLAQDQLAKVLTGMRNYTESNEIYYKLIKNKKSQATEFYYYIGDNFFKLGDKDKALESFFAGIKSKTSEAFALKCWEEHKKISAFFSKEKKLTIIEMLLEFKDYKEARKEIANFKLFYPKEEKQQIAYLEGLIDYNEENFSQAKKFFENALQLDSLNILASDCKLYVARCAYKIDKTDGINHYLDFAEKYPKHVKADEAIWKVGWIYEEKKDFKKAFEVFSQISKEVNTDYALGSKFRAGFCLYKAGEYQKALDFWSEKLTENLPAFETDALTYWIGKCYEKLGNTEKAGFVFTELAKKTFNTYYSLKSYQKIYSKLPGVPQSFLAQKGKNVEITDTKLLEIILLGEITKKEFAEEELKNFFAENKRNTQKIDQLIKTYETNKSYGKAVRIGINLTQNEISNTIDDSTTFWAYRINYPNYYSEIVENYAQIEEIPTELVWGIIRRESLFEEKIVSPVGARGLMQIMTYTGKDLAKSLKITNYDDDELFEAEFSVKLGAHYLAKLLKMFDNKFEPAIASYNAGESRVKNWIDNNGISDTDEFVENIAFSETRNYVRAVLKAYWIYQIIYEKQGL